MRDVRQCNFHVCIPPCFNWTVWLSSPSPNVLSSCTNRLLEKARHKPVSLRIYRKGETPPVSRVFAPKPKCTYCSSSQIREGIPHERLLSLPTPPPRRLRTALLIAQHPEQVIQVVAHHLRRVVGDDLRCALTGQSGATHCKRPKKTSCPTSTSVQVEHTYLAPSRTSSGTGYSWTSQVERTMYHSTLPGLKLARYFCAAL